MADEKGIHELYDQLGDDAAEQIWGDNSGNSVISRRGFLSRSALGAMAAAVGGRIIFGDKFPANLIP
ncbi:twin-arginine translocation signal domain-containing protein, partial [Akkermansiaceae bacterium]|nr:twin-arginine translocation signal domain-containing protein [Akkermansiaceae bacterium]